MKFHSLEQPPKEGVKKLTKELKEDYPGLEARMTFVWPLSKSRENALEIVKAEKPNKERVFELLKNQDMAEQAVAIALIFDDKNIITTEKDYAEIKLFLNQAEKSDEYICEIKKLIKAVDLKLIGRFEGNAVIPIIENILDNSDAPFDEKAYALSSISELGENAFPVLDKIIKQNKSFYFRRMATEIKFRITTDIKGDNAVFFLKEMSKNKKLEIRNAVASTLEYLDYHNKFTEKDINEIVMIIKKSNHYDIIKAGVRALSKFGEKILPILEDLAHNKNKNVKIITIEAIGNEALHNKKALSILEELRREEKDFEIYNIIDDVLKQVKLPSEHNDIHSWLLSSRKPLFTTPDTKELADRLKILEGVSKELKNKFQDGFIGLSVFGSTAKGYVEEESDLDAAIIIKNEAVLDYFRQIISPLKLCHMNYHLIVREDKSVGDKSVLFHGLFFGDRKELLKLQKATIEGISDKEWDEIREKIWLNEVNLYKAKERFNIYQDELKKIKRFVTLLRVPPPREEMLKILSKKS